MEGDSLNLLLILSYDNLLWLKKSTLNRSFEKLEKLYLIFF